MKSLKTLYGEGVERDPVFNDIAFRVAFPENTEAAATAMRERSEQLFNPFYEKWRTRLAKDISDALDKDLAPEQLVTEVAWMTGDEYREMLDIIEAYVDGDNPEPTQERFALKLIDAQFYMVTLKEQALQLLSSMLRHKLQNKARILTPFSNPEGKNKAGGQIIMP